MEEIERSRLLRNLWRDMQNDSRPDNTLAILNSSGGDIEVTDDDGITKIVYPRSIFHTARPKKSIIIKVLNGETNILATVKIRRQDLRNNMICVKTPIRYVDNVGNYAEIVSTKWVNKMEKKADQIIITPFNYYYIVYSAIEDSNIRLVISLFLVLLIAILIVVVLFI
jgi:hypothetical protein